MSCNNSNCNSCNDTSMYSCPIKDLSTDCVLYTGDPLECSGISTNKIMTEVIQDLDSFICNKFNDILDFGDVTNVGLGSKLYRGVSVTGQKEIRTVTSNNQNLINLIENTETLDINPGIPSLSLTGNVLSLNVSNSSGIVNYGDVNLSAYNNNSETLTSLSNPQNYDLEYQDENSNSTVIDLGPIVNSYITNNPTVIENIILQYLQANPSIICGIVSSNCAANIPPTVNAGTNQNITLPSSSVTTTATASDSDGTIQSVVWTQLSGPSSSTITGGSTLNPTFSNLTLEGTYEFRITATDNDGASASDTLLVIVGAAANVLPTVNSITYTTDDCCENASANIPPTVSAGADQSISASNSSLTATASDSDGTISSYLWELVSGGGGSTSTSTSSSIVITSPNSATTTITGLPEGSHTFRVTVTDNNGATAFDEVTVTYTAVIVGNTLFNITTGINSFTLESSQFINSANFTLEFDNVDYDSASSSTSISTEVFNITNNYDLSIPVNQDNLATLIKQNSNVLSNGAWSESGGVYSVTFQTLSETLGNPPNENATEYYISGVSNVSAT